MTIIRKWNCRQCHPMRRVCISAYCLSEHMNHPVCRFSACDKRVKRPCCRPHNIASRFIILRVFICDLTWMNQRTHQAFTDIIARIIICIWKILFANMIKNIINSGSHLIMWQCHCKTWIQNRKSGHNLLIFKHMPDLLLRLFVRNNRSRIHLRSCSNHSQNTADRNDLTIRLIKPHKIFLPRIFRAVHWYRHRLRIITYRSAAYRKQQICIMISGNLNSFI